MVHNPGGDWHPGKGDNPKYTNINFHPVISVNDITKLMEGGQPNG